MNKHFRQLVISMILITILCSPLTARGALVQLSSNSGEIRDLLQTDSNSLFAATQGGGIYKSTNGGTSWTRLSGLSEPYVWRLVGHSANPQLLYAATSKGLFKSEDGGLNWSQKTFDNVRAVAVDPFNLNHVLIGVPGAGIYITSDGGNSFSLSNAGLDSLDVTSIAFDPIHQSFVYAGLYSNLNGGWGGVFKSTNGGGSWINWNNPNNNGALGNKFVTALVVDDQGSIHAGTFSPNNLGGLYKQTGTGGWSLKQEVYGVETLTVDKSTQYRLWTGTRAYGPWVSNNNGENWNPAVNGAIDPDVYSAVYSLLTFSANPGKVLIGVKGLGLYQTTNSGGDWMTTGEGIKADRARAIVASPLTNPTTFYLGLAGGGVMKSTDNGMNWVDINTGLEVSDVETNLIISQLGISTTNANNLYAATLGRGLFHWNGTAWGRVTDTQTPPILPNNVATFLNPMGLIVDSVDDRVVYYSLFDSGGGVYRQDTTGTWKQVRQDPGSSKIVQSQTNNLRLYALMFNALPYKSTDGGENWAQVNAIHVGFEALSFFSIAENPLNPDYALASTNKGLFKSSDGGDHWTKVDPISGLGSTVQTGLVFSHTVNGRVWAVDLSGGYYCSKDNGATWVALSDPLLGAPILDLRFIDGALYLITDGSGILKDANPICP